MVKKDTRIWIWMQNKRMLKAISRQDKGTLTIYDEHNHILLRRTGLTKQQVKEIEALSKCSIKKLNHYNGVYAFFKN